MLHRRDFLPLALVGLPALFVALLLGAPSADAAAPGAQDGSSDAPASQEHEPATQDPATQDSEDRDASRGQEGTEEGSSSDADAREPQHREPQRFVRARTGGVTVRNLADVNGVPLADVREGGLMAVYSETAGWLEVDVPGGLPVWVFGRYVREVEDAEGVLEVTHNNVNMRPGPGNDVNNFPLMVRLVAGDQVAVIERQEPDAELSETWVRIWAPPGACGWVQAERTLGIDEGTDGAAVWAEAEAALASGLEPKGRGRAQRSASTLDGVETVEAAAPVGAAVARDALAAADAVFERERERQRPDFAEMRDAYDRVAALDTNGDLEGIVFGKLQTVDALEDVWRTRMLLEEERAERQRELARRQREQWERLRERDPFYGHFAVRGSLERFQSADGVTSYRVVRGGDPRAAVRCTSGRFELDLFVGREVGLEGGFQVGTDAASGLTSDVAAFVADLPAIDITAIEILD